jgi:hypothetical protein
MFLNISTFITYIIIIIIIIIRMLYSTGRKADTFI